MIERMMKNAVLYSNGSSEKRSFEEHPSLSRGSGDFLWVFNDGSHSKVSSRKIKNFPKTVRPISEDIPEEKRMKLLYKRVGLSPFYNNPFCQY